MRAGVLIAVAALLAAPAAADCTAEVAALFAEGGPNDPFARPPHHQAQQTVQPDGTVGQRSENRVETPLRTIANIGGTCTLVVDSAYWTGPCWQGPWTPGPSNLPEGRGDMVRQRLAEEARHVTEAECLGPAVLEDGRDAVAYRYRTQTEAAADGTYSGGLYTVYLDLETRHWLRWDVTETVTPWAMQPAPETSVTVITYDDSIRVEAPGD